VVLRAAKRSVVYKPGQKHCKYEKRRSTMPLGNVLGEFTYNAMSVKQTDLGGGRAQVEVNLAGESTGQVSGRLLATLIIEGSGPGRPSTYTVTGVLLGASGAVARFSSNGVGMRTGEGHKSRFRGAVTLTTDDPQLAAYNTMLAATEFEADPITLKVQGAVCEWK
jgi:hypothetical protein